MTTIGSKVRYGAIALFAIAIVAVGCSGDADPTPAPTAEPTPEPAAAVVEIVGNQFKFDPAEVTIESAGSTTIRLTNPDVVEHDWTVEELDIQVKAPAGDEGEIVLTDLPAGTYDVICTVPGHAAAGMVGTLVVTE